MSNFIGIRPVVAVLFRADGLTDTRKLIVGSRNFANTTKNSNIYQQETLSYYNKIGSV